MSDVCAIRIINRDNIYDVSSEALIENKTNSTLEMARTII